VVFLGFGFSAGLVMVPAVAVTLEIKMLGWLKEAGGWLAVLGSHLA